MIETGVMPETKVRYELHVPENAGSSKPPCVILVHGFQGKLEFHQGTAVMLSRKGVSCLIVDQLPLMSFFRDTRLKLREANAQAVISNVKFIQSLSDKIDPSRILLAGHSAGGAVVLEAATALENQIIGVLLLDAVPWVSTLNKARSCPNLVTANHKDILNFPKKCVVMSLRGEPNAWNADGLIMEFLARHVGGQLTTSNFDLKVVSALHGDFMCETADDEFAEHPMKGRVSFAMMRCFGLFTANPQVRVDIQDLIVSFALSMFRIDEKAFETNVEDLLNKHRIEARQVGSESVPDKLAKLPHFLK